MEKDMLISLKKELEETQKIGFEIIGYNQVIPPYASYIKLTSSDKYFIEPNSVIEIPTGLKLQIPEDHELYIYPSPLIVNTPLSFVDYPQIIKPEEEEEIILKIKNNLPAKNLEDYDLCVARLNTLDCGYDYIKPGIYSIKKYEYIAQAVLSKKMRFRPGFK